LIVAKYCLGETAPIKYTHRMKRENGMKVVGRRVTSGCYKGATLTKVENAGRDTKEERAGHSI